MRTVTVCANCAQPLDDEDQFCAFCGTRAPSGAPADPSCPGCGAAILAVDRFCGSCGLALAPGKTNGAAERLDAPGAADTAPLLPDTVRTLGAARLLAKPGPFCRSCGADHAPGEAVCPACGHDTRALPARLEGDLGKLYAFRRKLRKRLAVRIGDDAAGSKLLFESGEILVIPPAELPDEHESPVPPELGALARTPQGALLRLGEAVRRGAVRAKWDGDELVSIALAAVEDERTARLVAVDAIGIGRSDLVEQLPLSRTEQRWLAALDAASNGDAGAVVASIAELPTDGYRAKLTLLVVVAEAARTLDLSALEPHLQAYLAEEPTAEMLHRFFGFSTVDAESVTGAVAASRALLDRVALPEPFTREVSVALDALSGDQLPPPAALEFLPANARALVALQTRALDLLRAEDVDRIPLPVVDDLVDSGTLRGEAALESSADAERNRYLRGRLAPEQLTDEDVERLDHEPERVRRAFRYSEPDVLRQLADSPTVRHYRALVDLRRNRGREIAVDDVLPEGRAVVDDLMRLVSAKSDGRPLGDHLTESLVADPTVWPVVVEIAGARELATIPDLVTRFPAFAEWLALHEAREHLFLGDWQAAVTSAERCLALATAEPVRDEALNLRACGLHFLGDDDAAIATLEEAIEGAYSDALLANVGIVAAGLRPEVAARHLGTLITDAPTIAMRVAAARRALWIWSTSDTASWRNSDESPLPDAFQDALRALVVGPLGLDDFRSFASLLAVHDSDWFGDPANLAASPHRDSLEARFYMSRANDLEAMIDVMGEEIAGGSPPEWLLYERDSLRSAALDILFENLDVPDTTFGGVALAMVARGVLAEDYDRLLFHALGLASVSYHLTSRDEELADRHVSAVGDVRRQWQQLDGEQRTQLEPIVELATRRVAYNRLRARRRDIGEAIELFNSTIDLVSGAYPGSPAHLEAMRRFQAISMAVSGFRDELRPWLPLVDHEGVREELNETIETTRELERRCLELLG